MIHYADSVHGITTKMLQGFFIRWKMPLSPETHLAILKNSDHVVLAIDPGSGDGIGFVTAISDGTQAAFIALLDVLHESQLRETAWTDQDEHQRANNQT